MNNPGSLIRLHYHDNLELLHLLSETDGILYYKDAPVFPGIPVADDKLNGLVMREDGLFVSNLTTLTVNQYDIVARFAWYDETLFFDGLAVGLEHTDAEIQAMVDDVWNELEPPTDPVPPETTPEEGGESSDVAES